MAKKFDRLTATILVKSFSRLNVAHPWMTESIAGPELRAGFGWFSPDLGFPCLLALTSRLLLCTPP